MGEFVLDPELFALEFVEFHVVGGRSSFFFGNERFELGML
jgi:hypothetical protein